VLEIPAFGNTRTVTDNVTQQQHHAKQADKMQETKGLLDGIKQHNKLTMKVSSNANNVLPADVLKKLL